jgi:dissimilatory sulfite reductase (desulfoviridin) alpha/beta subunit
MDEAVVIEQSQAQDQDQPQPATTVTCSTRGKRTEEEAAPQKKKLQVIREHVLATEQEHAYTCMHCYRAFTWKIFNATKVRDHVAVGKGASDEDKAIVQAASQTSQEKDEDRNVLIHCCRWIYSRRNHQQYY